MIDRGLLRQAFVEMGITLDGLTPEEGQAAVDQLVSIYERLTGGSLTATDQPTASDELPGPPYFAEDMGTSWNRGPNPDSNRFLQESGSPRGVTPALDVGRLTELFGKHPIHWDVKHGTGTGTRYAMTRIFDNPKEAAEWVAAEYARLGSEPTALPKSGASSLQESPAQAAPSEKDSDAT